MADRLIQPEGVLKANQLLHQARQWEEPVLSTDCCGMREAASNQLLPKTHQQQCDRPLLGVRAVAPVTTAAAFLLNWQQHKSIALWPIAALTAVAQCPLAAAQHAQHVTACQHTHPCMWRPRKSCRRPHSCMLRPWLWSTGWGSEGWGRPLWKPRVRREAPRTCWLEWRGTWGRPEAWISWRVRPSRPRGSWLL
jgi:hypothetical protein